MPAIDVTVPDIGDFVGIPVIEVLVKTGDAIVKDTALITLESDKATMEVPSPAAGVVGAIAVKVGDKVSKGTPILTLDATSPSTTSLPPGNGSGGMAPESVSPPS